MQKKILIYNSGGGLGDSIQLFSLIISLQNHFKQSEIYYLGAHKNHFEDRLKEYNVKLKNFDLKLKYFGFRWWHFFLIKKRIVETGIKNFDIIINATSLGLKDGNDFNFNFSNTKNEVIYIDTIYNPLETKTYKLLKEEGKKVFNGLDMFIYQGQKSFYLWNKINPEIDNGVIELLNSKLK